MRWIVGLAAFVVIDLLTMMLFDSVDPSWKYVVAFCGGVFAQGISDTVKEGLR